MKNKPIKPLIDHWLLCPTCGETSELNEFVKDCVPHPDRQSLESCEFTELLLWVGPSFCRCGQALDLSELNEDPDLVIGEEDESVIST